MKKKVLIAIPTLMHGGTEQQVLSLIKALDPQTYSITVFCYFEYDTEMLNIYKSTGADVVLMTKNGKRPTSFYYMAISLFKGIKNILKDKNPDIVHVQYNAPGSLAVLFFKVLGAKKVIVTAHTPANTKQGKSKSRFILPRLVLRMTDAFICVSKITEKSFFHVEPKMFNRDLLLNGRKHFTVYNSTETISDAMLQKKDPDHFVIGMAARMVHQKGVDVLLRAIPKVHQIFSNIRLLIVGDGSEKHNYVQLAEELEIGHLIEWAGVQPKAKMPDYYARMDLLAMPSRFEGFGLTAIEAMSYGIPVVASAVDGLKEVIEHEKSGVLVKSEDPDAFAEAILELIQDDNKRTTLAMAGKQRIEENFSFDIYKQKINELYNIIAKDIG